MSEEPAARPASRLGQGQRILKNAAVGVGSGVIAAALELPLAGVLGRYLGVTRFGTYSFVIAFVRALQHFGDLGLRSILLREIAAATDRQSAQRALGVARGLVWLLSGAAFLLIVGLIHLLTADREVVQLTYLAGVALITILHANAYGAVCRAYEEMEYNAVGHVLERLLYFGLVLLVAWANWGLRGVFGALLIANLTLWVFYYTVVRRRYLRPRIVVDLPAWWAMAKEAAPVGIGVILRRFTWSVDIVLLAKMADVASAGLFGAAYRIPVLIHQLSVTLSHPFAPVYSKLARGSREELAQAYQRSFQVFWALGVPITVALVAFAEPIITLIFGRQFAPAAAALQIQSIATLFFFPTTLYVGLYTALGQQRLYMIITATCLGVNVLFDVLLIPRWTFVGASVATALAEIALFGMGVYFLRRLDLRIPLFRMMALHLAAGLVMGAFLYGVRHAPVLWAAAAVLGGVALYGLCLLLFRLVRASGPALGRVRVSTRPAAPPPAPGERVC